jgi:hypothetical protein
MNTLIRRTVLAGSAVTILVACGLAAHVSPEFKQQATTVGIGLLALISLSGLLAGTILSLFDHNTTGPEDPPGARATTASATHTGGSR